MLYFIFSCMVYLDDLRNEVISSEEFESLTILGPGMEDDVLGDLEGRGAVQVEMLGQEPVSQDLFIEAGHLGAGGPALAGPESGRVRRQTFVD